jgi:hypothetical protein
MPDAAVEPAPVAKRDPNRVERRKARTTGASPRRNRTANVMRDLMTGEMTPELGEPPVDYYTRLVREVAARDHARRKAKRSAVKRARKANR